MDRNNKRLYRQATNSFMGNAVSSFVEASEKSLTNTFFKLISDVF